jgi:GT2 family glycosyltransferase
VGFFIGKYMKISVIIATRNRLEDLRVTINGFLRQTYQDKEIVVVDNASTDGTRELLIKEFPEIKYFWLPDNIDIKGFNLAFELSEGDIIWRCDSDSHPENEYAFENVIEIFEKFPYISMIATEDIEMGSGGVVWDWYPLKIDKSKMPEDGFPANVFAGTGIVIRREVFEKIGGFWEFGFEESDFAARAILAGFNIRYFPNIKTLHYASPRDRLAVNRWIQISRQFMRFNLKYFPFWRAFGRAIQIFSFQLFMGIINRVPVSAFFECAFSLCAVSLSTWRNEHIEVTPDKLKEITLGVSLSSSLWNYFRQGATNKIKKWRKS